MTAFAHKTEGVNRTKTVRVYPFVFIASDDELQWKADRLFKQSLDQVNHRVLEENDLDCIMHNEYATEEFGRWIEGIPYQLQAEVEIDNNQFKEMIHSMLDDPNHGMEKDVYFYHSDHLGSASWITDHDGNPVQHLQYLPYGEPFVDQHPAGYQERYTFTGKERDEETGYGYFGARYMDHELMTMWLSVDPMADKYPNVSPYSYCMWSPIKLVDLDGMDTTVMVNLITGSVTLNYDLDNFNGTFVELNDGDKIINNYKCNGEISVGNDEGGKRDFITFSDNSDALKTFRNFTGEENIQRQSSVEWNYYEQKDGTGVLVTCHDSRNVCITGLEERFNKMRTNVLHHYHPKGPGVAHWTPSESDQQYAKDLKIPCYLHFSGQNYRFDDIVNKYGVMNHYNFQKHIPLGINIYQ